MPQRPTFSSALNSTLPQSLGLCAQDRVAVAGYVNTSMERLINDPLAPDEGWWGGWVTMLFNLNVTNHTASLRTPGDIARIIVLDICNIPRFLRNGFWEYLIFGTGHQPKGCRPLCCATQQAFDRDIVPTLIPFPTTAPQFLRFYPTDAADIGRRVVAAGLDKNGIPILGTDVATGAASSGETVILQLPFSTSLNEFQDVTSLIKDPTKGPVKIFTVDPVTGTQSALSSMDPNETVAGYRNYFFNGLPDHCCQGQSGIVQVFAQCKLDFVPVVADTDFLIIQSLPAIEEECQSIKYSKMDSPQAPGLEKKHHDKAIQLLNGQLDNYLGKTRTAISVPIFGSARLRAQPV